MKLPTLTKKQQEILKLLYKYRFLNRIQIQAFMGHKDRKTINLWLRDLREKQYVDWVYSTHFAEKTKPAVYYIGLNGVRWLKQQTYIDDDGDECYAYPPEEVRKRYREADRSQAYVERCILLAACCLNFDVTAKSNNGLRYTVTAQTEYLDESNEFNFITDSALESQLGPQLCVTKQKGKETTVYLIEAFDANLPQYRIRNRIKQYVSFLTEGDWEAARDDPLPIVLLICPRVTDLIYAKRRTRRLLADLWDEDKENVHIRFSTVDKVMELGATSKIWEEA